MTETFKILASAHVIIQLGLWSGFGMTSIGERLRRQRLQNRISLETVSLETKIGVRLLEAIEAEQFEKLPGGVFRRSFVLQYAHALGIDPEEIAAELKQLNQFDEPPPLPTPDMIRDRETLSGNGFALWSDWNGMGGSTIGSLLAAVGVMMACALFYSWWQTPRETRPSARTNVADARTPEPPPSAPMRSAPDTPKPAVAVESAPDTPKPALPVESAPIRVSLSADEATWISVSSDGKNIFANALQPHETKVVEASEKVRLLIGNAGGLEISLNGKPIGPIGPRGQIRVVELTSEGFQIVPRKL